MREAGTRAISRTAAALLITGLCAEFAIAQPNPPTSAPVHVFNPAGPGQIPRNVAGNSPSSAALGETSAGVVKSGIFPSGTLTYTCAPNVDATAPGTCNYLNTVIAGIYASRFTNVNASIYIQFGITGLGMSTSGFLNLVSYSSYLSALTSHSSGDLVDVAALASLPGAEPSIFSGGQIEVTSALGQALGLSSLTGTTSGGSSCTPGSSGCYNGIITVTTPANLAATQPGQTLYFRQNGGTQGPEAYDYYSVVEHETDEVLGTASCISTTSPMMVLTDGCSGTNASAVDLFRYSAPGTRVFQSMTPGAYFSYNGGNTNVAVYNTLANSNDYADWLMSCQHVQDAVGCLGASFDISNDGGVEIAVLDAVGYNATPVAPVISKAFSPTAIELNGVATLTLTILNPNNFTSNLTGLGFVDNLPAGMTVATPPNLTDTCGGAVANATSGSLAFSLAGGAMPAGVNGLSPGATCTVSVNVTGVTSGVLTNATNAVTSNEAGAGNTASATLTVLAPPAISKSFGPASIPLGANSALSFTIVNPNGVALTGVGFIDNLPAGVVVFSGSGANCDGTAVSATAGSTSIALAGATLPASTSCTFSITVTGQTAGVKNNLSGNVSASIAGAGNQAAATLDVVAPPVIVKSFSPNKFLPGGTTSVSFSITNPNSFAALSGVAFADSLPAALVVASPNGLSSNCGGTATATPGSNTIALAAGAIPSSSACTVTAMVTAPEGVYLNSVQVTSTNGGVGNTSSATVYAATPPNLSKVFGEASIGPLSSTTLSFTLMNPNHIVTLDALQFSDTLPSGLAIATPNGSTGSCGGGTIIAPAGGTLITLGSAVLAPQASCTFSVNVTATGAVLGYLTNITSTVTSIEALPGAAASAILFIGDPFLVTYASNLNVGESYLDITNTGASGAPVLGPGFGGAAGNICVNVYAFDSGEELIACCSCLITPDQTVNLGVNRDLTPRTITGAMPSSVTIKLLATLAGAGGSSSSCPQSAATVSTATLANGMAAWATKLHATPTPGAYDTTEAAFTGSTLSAGELASIGGRCSSILGNGSGFGVCNSCQGGALGASKFPQYLRANRRKLGTPDSARGYALRRCRSWCSRERRPGGVPMRPSPPLRARPAGRTSPLRIATRPT